MRPNDRTERNALNDANLKVRMVGQQLKSEGVNPNAPITRDVFLASLDLIKDELGKINERISTLEATLAKAAKPVMIYSGEWVPGFEYDAGNLVEYAGGVHVAVQPIHDGNPPHRGNGWVTLVQGA